MTTNIPSSVPFTLTLFKWIRSNKDKLYASSLPDAATSPIVPKHAYDIEAYRDLKNCLASVERRLRGATAQSFFPGFNAHATLSVIHRLLACQGNLRATADEKFNTLWESLFQLPGVPAGQFSTIAKEHIEDNRLPLLASAFKGVTVSFSALHELVLSFNNGAAQHKVTSKFVVPVVEGLTLGEQIAALNQYWAEIKVFALTELKNAKNWPTDAQGTEIETRRVAYLTEQFIKGLRPSDKALFTKHPERFREVFNQHF